MYECLHTSLICYSSLEENSDDLISEARDDISVNIFSC